MVRDFSFLTTQSKGFTIPELLVVIAIIVLLTSFTLPNWRAGDQSLALERAAFKLSQDVRRAQELALRAQAFTCLPPGSITGYGIAFNTSTPGSYTLFADCNGNNIYDPQDSDVDVIEIERSIFISSLVLFPPQPSVSKASVIFIPPIPLIWLKPGNPQQLQIQLISTGGEISKSVTITRKGIIDIE